MTENEKDISLLHSEPSALILKYQETVRFFAERYVRSGMFREAEIDDIVQSVNEGLLRRIPSIVEHYNGTATLIAYLSAIIRNICLQLREKQPMQLQTLGTMDPGDPTADRMFERLAIGDAVRVLQEVFELYHGDKGRLIILLRLWFRLPLDKTTILMAFPKARRRLIRRILEALGRNVGLKTERGLFVFAAPYLNELEKKRTSGDSYRRWLGERIPEVLSLLQARLHAPGLDMESLRTLIEAMTLQFEDRK